MTMKTFSEKERFCEATFASLGPYWHAYTNGKETPLLFRSDEDFVFVMNVVALAASLFPGVVIIAFEVMDNHFHFVLSGTESEIMVFWRFIRKKLSRLFPLLRDLELHLKSIDDLQAMRNNIVYTHRNGYVVRPDCTPFSYLWGSGRYYFQKIPCTERCGRIKVEELRRMFKGRAPVLHPDWGVLDGHISPASFCAVGFGESLFRDAHHYFAMIGKNVESYSELAVELDDEEFLTDSELFAQISRTLKSAYGVERLSALTGAQKLDLARSLRFEWRSSNGQIRRLLGLSTYEVDALFPRAK